MHFLYFFFVGQFYQLFLLFILDEYFLKIKMAKVHLLNVTVHNNPAPFYTPFQFEIHFECLEELQDGELNKKTEKKS